MRNKKLKQLFALGMAVTLCLTACGNGEKTPSSSEGKVETASTNGSEQPEEKMYWELLDEVSDTSELPDWTGEQMEINVWVAGGTDYLISEISKDDVVMKEITRVTGVSVNVDRCYGNGGDNIDAKLPRIIATKDYPTLVFGWDIDKQLKDLWENGYLADLTEYYMDGTLDHLLYWLPMEELDGILYTYMRDDEGAYYRIPSISGEKYYQATGYAPIEYDQEYFNKYAAVPVGAGNINTYFAMYIRDDILEALYPDCYTIDELKEIYMKNGGYTADEIFDIGLKSKEDVIKFFYDVQEVVESGNFVGLDGKPVETTYGPNTEKDNWAWMKYLPSLFGIVPNSDYFAVAEKDSSNGLLINRAIDSEPMIEWMKDLNQMVNDNVFVRDSLVDNKATYDEKLLNGHYAIIYGDANNVNIDGSSAGWDYRPVWVDADLTQYYYGFEGMPTRYEFAVFKDAVEEDQMDQLMHFVDYLNSKVGILNLYWGPASAGLFTVDEDGKRTYVNEELKAAMETGVDSSLPWTYGLLNGSMSQSAYSLYPVSGNAWYNPSYISAADRELSINDAERFYTPGILKGYNFTETATKVYADNQVYSLGSKIEGLAQFWGARSGFEAQLKKVLVAADEDAFNRELEVLRDYTEENGFTDEVLKEYNDYFIEFNYDLLKEAGIVD